MLLTANEAMFLGKNEIAYSKFEDLMHDLEAFVVTFFKTHYL